MMAGLDASATPGAILPGPQPSAPSRLVTVWHRSEPGADTLVVLLPGAYMEPAQFAQAGFAQLLAASGHAVDLALPALTLDQLADGSALPALHEQLIIPAHQGGYRQVWLGGISLGGFLALSYARQHPQEISGLCLLAPYPGSRITLSAIAAAGGPGCWQPTPAQWADEEFRVWQWMSQQPTLPMFVGFGAQDRFARAIALLASRLPVGAIHTAPGGHDWPTWAALWQRFLQLGWLSPPTRSA